MTTERPRIAVPEPTAHDPKYNQRSLPQYLRAIEAAGGTGVPIDLLQPLEAQAALVASCAGILLPGSPADVDPRRYGQEPVEACAAKDAAREAADDLLLCHAFEHGKPLLGICFGLQSLNVWRHGSLIQDLPKADDGRPGVVNHEPGRDVQEAHRVVVSTASRLSKILASDPALGTDPLTLFVNSSHHQAIDHPGEGLSVAARSPDDGVIEALETTAPDRFVLAVQWHPERSYEHSAASRALFSSFLSAARTWQSSALINVE